MDISVSLITNKENELNDFLSTYYEKNMNITTKTFKWSAFYHTPFDCIDLVTTAVDNNDKFSIQVLVHLPELEAVISDDNINDFVKYIYLKNT